MTLSIITITYNNFSELMETVNSIPNFDFIESVVVNGGDSEETKEFLKSYKGKSISEKDNGIADAFNKGIKLSSGDLIMFLNSGDILIDHDYLSNAVEYLSKHHRVDFTHSNIILTEAPGVDLYMRAALCNLGRGMPYLHPTMIFRKSIFDKIGLFNITYKIAMDFDLIVRIEKAGFQGYYDKERFPIKMKGAGKSISMEGVALRECFAILKAGRVLNAQNFLGYCQRYILFLGRKLLNALGLNHLLLRLKKRKHRA